ncbi:MAG: phospholipid carrier-dependent glycosyltransferase [Anaerolineae bacterium]
MTLAAAQLHRRLAAALFLALLSVYLFTYSGRPTSSDELRIMDGITSFYHFGDWLLDETLYLSVPSPILPTPYPAHNLPSDERSAAWYALPLYALAHAVPALGMVHMVWLLNMLAMAAAGVVMFGLALALGYTRGVAVTAALALGLGTLVWPYSKTLFRDPLLLLFLSAAALGVLRARSAVGRQRWGWATAALVALALAALTKVAAVFALPALAALAWPRPLRRWVVLVLSGVPLVAIAAIMLVPPLHEALLALAMQIFGQSGDRMAFAPEALYAYLVSPTASLWATSPALLLGAVGAALLWQHGDGRVLLAVIWIVTAFALGHALTTAHHWFGGFSYPPRFLLPVIPFALLLALPTMEVALKRRGWRGVVVLGWLLLSGWVQWTHAASFIHEYSTLLPPESFGALEWPTALQDLSYSRWWLLPQTWGALGFDVAWWRAPLEGWTLIVVAVGVTAGGMIGWLARGGALGWRWLASVFGVWGVALFGLLITLNRHDGAMFSASAGAAEAYAILEAEAREGDLLLTPFSAMTLYLFNHNRLTTVRPFTLPIPKVGALDAGVSADQLDPLDAVHPWLPQVMGHFAARQDRAWFFTNSTPFQPQAPRVDEHYLSTRFYLVREYPIPDIDIRLLHYILEPNPPYADFQPPAIPSDITFGGLIALEGATLPRGDEYRAGDALPVLLHWRALRPIERDYTIALFVANEAGEVVAQGGDGAAVGGWMPTRRWPAGQLIPDRRGLLLADGLPAGEYQLWVVLYEFVDGQIVRLPVTTGAAVDGTIAVLPLTLRIK